MVVTKIPDVRHRSAVVIVTLRPPRLPFRPLKLFQFVRNKMYDTVADNRYSVMGKREECRCSDERYADRFL